MADIRLKQPWLIDGVVRQPAEGVITVPDDLAVQIPPDVINDEVDEDVGTDTDDLDGLTMPDLGIIVTKEGVPLNGATKKADVIAAIRNHRNPADA